MLRLILGVSGTGKSREIYRRIADRHLEPGPTILLVPEQYSFESEKALYELLGAQRAQSVQVLSFTRLCHKIFYRYGQVAGEFVTQAGKYLLMSLALEQVRDELNLYRAQSERASFVPVALELTAEFKNAGAIPETVLKAAQACEDERLRDKLGELGIIYQAYQALLERSYRDPADDIARAMRLSAGKGTFHGAAVYIDSFAAFLAPELQFIQQMLEEGADVTVALCCDGHTGNVFAPVSETIRRLQHAARRAGTAVEAPMVLETPYRAKNEAMRYLCRNYLCDTIPFDGEQDVIRVAAAGDVFEEAEWIARRINALVYDEGYRFREIAVITRSLPTYTDAFETAFARYHIPVYFDRRENAEHDETANLILTALLSVRNSYDTAQIISLAKLPLLGLAEEDAFELEHYVFVWGVRGRLWLQPFVQHPDGLGARMTDESRERLERIERARQMLIEPLIHLRDALAQPSGTSFAHGVWAYLTETGTIERLWERDAAEPDHAAVDVPAALFDELVDLLDLFDRLIGGQRLSKTRLIELWRLAVQSCEVGKLPQTLDQVIIGTADRIRPVGVRAAFVCGAAEGEFPLRLAGTGLLTDREREKLGKGELRLNVAKTDLAALERFYTYYAVTIPADRLVITYPTRTVSGEEKRPSLIARTVERLFPDSVVSCAEWEAKDPLAGLITRENAYALLCASWGENTPLHVVLREAFAGTNEEERLRRAVDRAKDKRFSIRDSAVSRRLFGRTLALSPSRLETYFGCAFAYFCSSGLHLKKKRKAEFSPLESGTLIHYVLEVLIRKYCAPGVSLPEDGVLREETAKLVEEYLADRVEDRDAMDERFHYLFTRLCGMLARLTRRLYVEFSQSAFTPYAFEAPIETDAENRPLVFKTPGGNRVFVRGIVDRIDLCESAEGKYLRVVDYKSGQKRFQLSDIYYGLNMQMLIYLFTLTENGDKVLRGAIPAGVLYMPAREETLTVERSTSPEKISALRADGYRMDGLLLENIAVLERMEQGLDGVFIPVKRKKDGTLDSQSKVATLEEFGRLRRRIERLVCEMADKLIGGDVGALPASGLGYDPCAFCDFRAVCRREEGHPKRELIQWDRNELFEQLRREEEETNAGGTLDPGAERRD